MSRRRHVAASPGSAPVVALVCILVGAVVGSVGCGYDPGATGSDPTGGPAAVTVAVVDTGVSPVGALRGRLEPGVRCAPTCEPAAAVDADGHGTAVAGLLVAPDGTGLDGPPVRIVPVRAADDRGRLSVAGVANGIRWAADRGVGVIAVPLVLGGDREAVAAAIRDAPQSVVVVPAGNDGLDVDDRSLPVHPCVDPAPNVLCVAAGTDDGTPLAASNRGSTSVDLVAPGSNLRSLDPAGRSVQVSGTSFAVPAAAAAAAALRRERPGATGAELAVALRCGRRVGDGLAEPAATVGGFLDPELARVAIVTGRCSADG